jgi:hypothetical protein
MFQFLNIERENKESTKKKGLIGHILTMKKLIFILMDLF